MIKIFFFIAFLQMILVACGNKNLRRCDSSSLLCAAQDPEEEARNKLNQGDPDASIALLEPLVNAEVTEENATVHYRRYPLLAAAYAAKAGVDLFSIVKNLLQDNSSSAGPKNIFAFIDAGIPSTQNNEQVNEKLLSIQKAINLLNSMPEKYKVENSEIAYSDEVAFLMNFFRIVYSTLFLRKFSNVGVGSKDFDPSQLDTMTDEEAEAVVNQLRAAAQASAASQNPAMQEKIDKALSDYDNASGSSKDKLKELLKPKTGS